MWCGEPASRRSGPRRGSRRSTDNRDRGSLHHSRGRRARCIAPGRRRGAGVRPCGRAVVAATLAPNWWRIRCSAASIPAAEPAPVGILPSCSRARPGDLGLRYVAPAGRCSASGSCTADLQQSGLAQDEHGRAVGEDLRVPLVRRPDHSATSGEPSRKSCLGATQTRSASSRGSRPRSTYRLNPPGLVTRPGLGCADDEVEDGVVVLGVVGLVPDLHHRAEPERVDAVLHDHHDLADTGDRHGHVAHAGKSAMKRGSFSMRPGISATGGRITGRA